MPTLHCSRVHAGLAVLALLLLAPPAVAADKVYWVDTAQGLIQRSDPGGSNLELVLAVNSPNGIAIDRVGGRILNAEDEGSPRP